MFSVLPSIGLRKALLFSFAQARCRFAFAVAYFHATERPLLLGVLPGKKPGRGEGGELLPRQESSTGARKRTDTSKIQLRTPTVVWQDFALNKYLHLCGIFHTLEAAKFR